MPAQPNNLNAAKNGTKLSRLTLGELPKELTRVKRLARQYRRELETACVDVHNEVSVTHGHLIDEAAVNEQHAAVCRWLLNQRIEKMSVADILSCSREITKAKANRNRAVAQLKLDAKSDPWAELDALPHSPPPGGNGQDHATRDATGHETSDSTIDDVQTSIDNRTRQATLQRSEGTDNE